MAAPWVGAEEEVVKEEGVRLEHKVNGILF